MKVVYFSSVSNNTHRFVEKLGRDTYRIPLRGEAEKASEPFVLVVPTYGAGRSLIGAVPPQVRRYLDENHQLMLAVIATGNKNFGAFYGAASRVIHERFGTPIMDKVELMGTPWDVKRVNDKIDYMEQRRIA